MSTTKVLTLDSLVVSNYKKLRHQETHFFTPECTIIGPNGSGKSTHWDVWHWLWTGYDLEGRFNHEVKPWLTDARNTEERVVVSVTGNITYDGEKISLRRELHELWKPESDEDPTEKYDSDTTKYWINDSPIKTKKEWEARLNAIYPLSAFSAVTNPDAFLRMKPEDMRKVVIDLVGGDITNEEIIATNPDYTKLVTNTLKTRTIDGYKKEINDNISAGKKEQDALPEQIKSKQNEVAKLISDNDFNQIENSISIKKEVLAATEAELEGLKSSDEGKGKIVREQEIADLKADLQRFSQNFKTEVTNGNSELLTNKASIQRQIDSKQTDLTNVNKDITRSTSKIADLNNKRVSLRSDFEKLNVLEFPSPEQVVAGDHEHGPECQTCKRGFSNEEYASFEGVLRAAFNEKKKTDKAKIREEGQAVTGEIAFEESVLELAEKSKNTIQKEIDDLTVQINAIKLDERKPEDQAEYIEQSAIIKAKKEELEKFDTSAYDASIKEVETKISGIKTEISDLTRSLGKKDSIEVIKKSIAELEANIEKVNAKVLDWKKAKSFFEKFLKDRASILEGRVNGMFEHMKFTMFRFLNDGTPEVTCIPTYQGVSYPNVNTGFLPMLYVDVANAFTKRYGTTLPIFLDNMESVGKRPETECQVINIVYPKYDPDVKTIEVIEGEYKPKKSK
ncbi:hypothetical protein [Dyadobacter sp. CY312]|uniref:hypothetical protein n=1 Tax=Dyadobacter sp. CY312 TaxID=2907303 RepID=UPI001F1E02CB|nr:hypothetical protein [Dyadobacter sp. CY312]MCE7039286.1 hypothetical protein [Dyadobacter sp. CY312]